MLITTQKAIYELDRAVLALIRYPQTPSNVARYVKALARVAGCTQEEVRVAIGMQGKKAEGSEQ
jgi:hypothetical protein